MRVQCFSAVMLAYTHHNEVLIRVSRQTKKGGGGGLIPGQRDGETLSLCDGGVPCLWGSPPPTKITASFQLGNSWLIGLSVREMIKVFRWNE